MRTTGIIRRVDDLGRIVIPKETRRILGIAEGTPMELFVDGNKVVLRKYNSADAIKNCLDELKNTIYEDESMLGNGKMYAAKEHIEALQKIFKES